MAESTCRRCSDCPNNDHHWMEECDIPECDDADPTFTHICKHCPVKGMECDECQGSGRGEYLGLDTEGQPDYECCSECKGEGVIPLAECTECERLKSINAELLAACEMQRACDAYDRDGSGFTRKQLDEVFRRHGFKHDFPYDLSSYGKHAKQCMDAAIAKARGTTT